MILHTNTLYGGFVLFQRSNCDWLSDERGLAFYRRLLACSDEKLQAGKLPRDEVEAGLREWQAAWPRLSAGGTGTAPSGAESAG
ncbi:DUF6483 family protein [Paenibacillus sp. GbtcB18]|uniref:DUF6483 family protein n=1 Tax=Paenibacillus sp. GbtcB18 TaxID=2824763 RepID=UPI001C304F29|nr:DUF6483 family protein [Paenibacillus sp. GbtcB18]